DTPKLVAANIQNKLRSNFHWSAPAYTEAARFALSNNDLDAASTYIDRALLLGGDATTLRVKARIAEKKGDAETAKTLRAKAAAMVPDQTALSNVYQLIGAKKADEAIAAANALTAADAKSWRALTALGDAYAAKGDNAKARELFD